MKKIFLIIVFLFLIVGCNSKEVDGRMTISLIENPTTGYEWSCEISDFSVLALENNNYVANSNEEDLVGAPGVHEFIFKSLKEGKTDIVCSYERNWEDEEPLYQLTYKVKVDSDLNITFESVDGTYSEKELPKPVISSIKK